MTHNNPISNKEEKDIRNSIKSIINHIFTIFTYIIYKMYYKINLFSNFKKYINLKFEKFDGVISHETRNGFSEEKKKVFFLFLLYIVLFWNNSYYNYIITIYYNYIL